MKKIIIFFFTLSLLCVASQAQQPSGSTAPAAQQRRQEDPNARLAEGIRFVLIGNVSVRTVYTQVSKDTIRRIGLRPSFPSQRVEVPQDGKLRLLDKSPLDAADEQRPQVLLESDVPRNLGSKLLGLIGQLTNGQLYIVYIADASLVPGTTLFKNMTNKDYLIDFANVPQNEKSRVEIKGGTEYLFGRNISEQKNKTYPTTLMHVVNFQGQPRWMVNRRFMTTRSMTKSFIRLMLPNPQTNDMFISDITLMMERRGPRQDGIVPDMHRNQ